MSRRRNRRQRKVALQGRLCTALALVGALAIHALLFWGFRIRPTQPPEKIADLEADSVLLPPLTDRNLQDWQRDLHNWTVLADPTLLTLPQEVLGFSSALKQARPRPQTDIPPHHHLVVLVPERPFPEFRLTGSLPPLADELARLWIPAMPPIPPAPAIPRLPVEIVWRWRDGTRLADAPPLAPEAVAEALQTGPAPRDPTVVEILRPVAEDGYARLRIRRHSGNPQLDMLVLRGLRNALTPIELRTLFGHATATPSYWPPSGQTRRIEVDWSLIRTAEDSS